MRRGLILVTLATVACGGGSNSGSSGNPAAPTATVPAGCSGNAVKNVRIGFSGGSSGEGANFQLFGETFNQTTIQPGTTFLVERSVVPCSYEISGQMLGRSLQISFARGNGIDSGDQGGVERGSIAVDEGPSPTLSTSQVCAVNFSAPSGNPPAGSGLTPPIPFKIRFRVATSNGYGSIGSGC